MPATNYTASVNLHEIATGFLTQGTHSCQDTHSVWLSVGQVPIFVITASPTDHLCFGDPVTLTVNTNGGVLSGSSFTPGTPFTPVASRSDSAWGTDPLGVCNDTAYIALTVSSPTGSLSTTVTPNDTVCAGTQITLTSTGATNYAWTGGAMNGTPFVPTTQLYRVTGTDGAGNCVGRDSIQITVNPSSHGNGIHHFTQIIVF